MRVVAALLLCALTLLISFYGLMALSTWWVSHRGGNQAEAQIGLAMFAAPVALGITVVVGLTVFLRVGKPRP